VFIVSRDIAILGMYAKGIHVYIYNLRMDNPETLATRFRTQTSKQTTKTQTNKQKIN